jgi:hypothetical protein
MKNSFDELTKSMAQSVTRRAALSPCPDFAQNGAIGGEATKQRRVGYVAREETKAMKMTDYFRNMVMVFLALATAGPRVSTQAMAATITVSNTSDSGAGSLRRAIQNAASGDTINFSVGGTIVLTTGELLVAKNLSIVGAGASSLAVSGHTNSRVFEISSNATVSISDLTIQDGHAPNRTNATVTAGNGGGILNAGNLALTRCTVSGNVAGSSLLNILGNPAAKPGGNGGGIYNLGTLALTSCTLSGNVAGKGDVGAPGGAGGSGGAVFNAGNATLTACTVSGNQAGAGGNSMSLHPGVGGSGGGIYNATNASPARLRNILVVSNLAGLGGAVLHLGSPSHPGPPGPGPDLFGAFTSQGCNLAGIADFSTGLTNGVSGDLAGSGALPIDASLGPLQNNGGPTFTMALLSGSPALNAGDDALLSPPFNLATDQRGLPRKFGTHVDIGAFESQSLLQATQAQSQITSMTSLPNGQIHFTVVTAPETAGRIEASQDLQTWTALTDFTSAADGTYEFIDVSAPLYAQRFYRVVTP